MTNALYKKQSVYLIKDCVLQNGYIFPLKVYLIQDISTAKFSHHEYIKQKMEFLADYGCYESDTFLWALLTQYTISRHLHFCMKQKLSTK
jgi:hypothetical protein